MIVFTFRELKTAWLKANEVFSTATTKSNAHRLLLFYAIENGLKAVLLQQEGRSDSEGQFQEELHDLNKLMDRLRLGKDLRLPSDIRLQHLKQPERQRNAKCGELNQVWRYGATAQEPNDVELEAKLSAINEWIQGALK